MLMVLDPLLSVQVIRTSSFDALEEHVDILLMYKFHVTIYAA